MRQFYNIKLLTFLDLMTSFKLNTNELKYNVSLSVECPYWIYTAGYNLYSCCCANFHNLIQKIFTNYFKLKSYPECHLSLFLSLSAKLYNSNLRIVNQEVSRRQTWHHSGHRVIRSSHHHQASMQICEGDSANIANICRFISNFMFGLGLFS